MFSSCAALRRPHSELLVRRAAFALRARNMGSVTSQAAAPNLVAKAAGGTEKFFRKNFQQKFPGVFAGTTSADSVVEAQVGFMGPESAKKNPNYREVCSGSTGHVEVLSLKYDPSKCQYEDLVRFFFTFHDPTTQDRQGNDAGPQYASAIFYHNEAQKATATKVKEDLSNLLKAGKVDFKGRKFEGDAVTTAIVPATEFYPAHDEHQQYLENNPMGYCNHGMRFLWPDC